MQLLVLRQPFDRRDVPAVALHRENQARQHALLVKKDRAGSARTLIAALLRAGQAEMLAQRVVPLGGRRWDRGVLPPLVNVHGVNGLSG
jgi:hypothetical protein